MTITCRAAMRSVLLAGTLLVAALSSDTQANRLPTRAHPIANGQGAYVDLQTGDPITFTFSVVELPNGSVQGHGSFFNQGLPGFFLFDPGSYMFMDGSLDSLGVAGKITLAVNSPPQLAVGRTIFFFVNDNNPDTDEIAALGLVPEDLGDLTIQEIVVLIGGWPPPEFFAPLDAGDIRIF